MTHDVIKKAGLKNKPINFNQERPENKGNQFNTTDKVHVTWQKNFWYLNSMGFFLEVKVDLAEQQQKKPGHWWWWMMLGPTGRKLMNWWYGDIEERCMKDQHETN